MSYWKEPIHKNESVAWVSVTTSHLVLQPLVLPLNRGSGRAKPALLMHTSTPWCWTLIQENMDNMSSSTDRSHLYGIRVPLNPLLTHSEDSFCKIEEHTTLQPAQKHSLLASVCYKAFANGVLPQFAPHFWHSRPPSCHAGQETLRLQLRFPLKLQWQEQPCLSSDPCYLLLSRRSSAGQLTVVKWSGLPVPAKLLQSKKTVFKPAHSAQTQPRTVHVQQVSSFFLFLSIYLIWVILARPNWL